MVRWRLAVAAVSLVALGCATIPGDPAQPAHASYVGDRAHLGFGEVVVSVPTAPEGASYHNLHVGLAAIINPTRQSSSSLYEVQGIVRRMEPRIAARVVGEILSAGALGPAQLGSLRGGLAAAAQAEFDSAFAKWRQATNFEVEVVVVSLYFTDGSVGREALDPGRLW